MKLSPQLSSWLQQGQYIEFDGHRIFYREQGEGPALLLIHGFPTASWDWYRLWPELTKKFRVLAPDMIGFGFSEKPASYPYSLMRQADLLTALLKAKGIEDLHILAHDYGDTVAQELIARQMEHAGAQKLNIRSVTLLNGGIFPGQHRPRLIQKLLASPVGWMLTPFLGKAQLSRTFNRIFGTATRPSPEEMDDFWSLIAFNNGKAILPKLIRYMQERNTWKSRWVEAIVHCPVPLLHINGTDDPISGRHVGAYFAKMNPKARVEFLEGIGHYPQVEDPESVLRYFFDFVKM
ncbi:MAG: alpha/beta hydrolase [Bacteroidetes bacterium]|nr:MAG: alpha/beta hydrolase [Bacteroidota bacterium]